jgi:redox-sensitive bicupin YhaK (pirin superfamily)
MITLRKSADRGHANFGWLDSHHTFSFGGYHDPAHMGFGPLRVINEDRVAPGGGFAPHGHANMEIVSYVLRGALEHKDSIGTGSVIRPGDVQRMSAGSGIQHSEFNASRSDPVHFLQIWILPDRQNIAPGYAQKHFTVAERSGRLRLVASGAASEDAIGIRQDASIFASLLAPGECVRHDFAAARRGWLQLASGAVKVNGVSLAAGDGAAIHDEPSIDILADSDAELLLFDLP